MDLRKPKQLIKQQKDKGAVISGGVGEGVMYNMAIVATDHLMKFAMTEGKDINDVTRMTKPDLAEFLTQFYKCYKHSGEDIISIRDGLFRFFQNESGIDIINDRLFYYANISFDKCLTSQQKLDLLHRVDHVTGSFAVPNGHAGVNASLSPVANANRARSSPVPATFSGIKATKQSKIPYDSMKKLYLSEALNGDTPEFIQNKVYFDINLYIINRGKDCLKSMVKTDFDISTDEKGKRYVWLKYSDKFSIREVGHVPGDERTVSFGGIQLGDRMYERPGDPRCPVVSFLKYVTHLHPMTDAFWQRPKRQVNKSDYVWYDNTALGNSSLSKFMQKICLQGGLSETFTNSSIKPIYKTMIEAICQKAMGYTIPQPVMQVLPEASIKKEKQEDDEDVGNEEESSSDSEFKQDLEELPGRSQGVDLREAKMEVLNSVQKLKVKDIQKFVDWLKTVKVIKNGGELMVLCSHVDKATVDPELDVPDTNVEDKEDNSSTSTSVNGNKSDNKTVHEVSMDNSEGIESLHGISIKQVDFLSLDYTHCSCKELLPLKVTIPTNDSMLLSGITDDTQLLLHRKCGALPGSEKLKDRVFYSENSMDVAEVAALLGTRKKVKNSVNTVNSSSDFKSNLPPRKRQLADPMFNIESPSKKLCNITNIDEDDNTSLKLETNLNCLKPSTLKSLPLRHKKKVRFTSGVQAFKLKTEPLDT